MEVDNTRYDTPPRDVSGTPIKTVANNSGVSSPDIVSVTPESGKRLEKSPTDTNSDKKRRIRRKHKGGKHHRKWKPYSKMSWDERKVLEEKECRKATLKREEQFASGQPMAPYNTTQFLMDIHDPDHSLTPELNGSTKDSSRLSIEDYVSVNNNEGSGSLDSSDEYYSSPDDEEIFLEKEFSHDYESYHADYIHSLSKEELVKQYIDMEKLVEKLTKQLQRERDSSSSEKDRTLEDSSVKEKRSNDELLQKTLAENEQLRKEIERLRQENTSHIEGTGDNKENNPETLTIK